MANFTLLTQPVTPFAKFQVSSGNQYSADANGLIANVPLNDVKDLFNVGCEFNNCTLTTLALQGLLTNSTTDGITALAGGGQSGSPQLSTGINRITVVASALDSAQLPPGLKGESIVVVNSSSAGNGGAIYPAGNDILDNGLNYLVVPPQGVAMFVCTSNGVWYHQLYFGIPNFYQYRTNGATTSATLAATDIAGTINGVQEITLNLTGALSGAANATLPTAASLFAAFANAVPFQKYKLRIQNTSSGNFAWTVLTNTGWTLNGTMTIAQNAVRSFYVSFNSSATATLQSIDA